MLPSQVDTLLDAFDVHPYLGFNIDRAKFKPILGAVDTSSPSRRFYEKTPNTTQIEQEGWGREHYVSIRRVMRNDQAKGYRRSALKRGMMTATENFSRFASTRLTRILRQDTHLVALLADCETPFSLLGKVETWDRRGEDGEHLYRSMRPLLIIPGLKVHDKVTAWEQEHTTYQKTICGCFGWWIDITENEFHKGT